jgi:hypothetical protein
MPTLYNVYVVVAWEIEYTDQFGEWWETLTEDEQDAIDAAMELLGSEARHLVARSQTTFTSRGTRT